MKRKRAGLFTALVIAALSLYAVASFVSTRAQISGYEAVRGELESEAAALSRENARLEYETAAGTYDERIEAAARERLGLVYPGETVFYDIGG